jgi:hypothetical protein
MRAQDDGKYASLRVRGGFSVTNDPTLIEMDHEAARARPDARCKEVKVRTGNPNAWITETGPNWRWRDRAFFHTVDATELS